MKGRCFAFFLALACQACAAPAAYLPIRMGVPWPDTEGREIQAQGGDLRKFGDLYHLYGAEYVNRRGHAVKCYTSRDLVNWKFENDVLTEHMSGRVDVVYNAATRQYVMLTKSGKGMGVAVAPSPTGPFRWVGYEELPESIGGGDTSVFQAEDGRAYYIYTCWPGDKDRNRGIIIALLAPDYLRIDKVVHKFEDARFEAPCIFVRDGVHYLFVSELRAWKSSPTHFTTAKSVDGPWTPWKVLKTEPPSGDSYNSQVDFVVSVRGSRGSFFMYCGDRYSNFTKIGKGKNVWLPLEFDGEEPVLRWREAWNIDAAAGTWSEAAATE